MPPALDSKSPTLINLGTAPVFGAGQVRQSGGQIQFCQRAGALGNFGRMVENCSFQAVIETFFNFERTTACVENPCLVTSMK